MTPDDDGGPAPEDDDADRGDGVDPDPSDLAEDSVIPDLDPLASPGAEPDWVSDWVSGFGDETDGPGWPTRIIAEWPGEPDPDRFLQAIKNAQASGEFTNKRVEEEYLKLESAPQQQGGPQAGGLWAWLERTSTAVRIAAIAVAAAGAALITAIAISGDGASTPDAAVEASAVPEVAVTEPAAQVTQPTPTTEVATAPTTTLETLVAEEDPTGLDKDWLMKALEVPPLLYTSFLDEPQPKEFFESSLGPVLPLTDVDIRILLPGGGGEGIRRTSPSPPDPAAVFEEYAPMADVAFAATADSSSPGETMLVVGFRIEADLTDPGECGGNLLNLVVNLDNPAFGDPYVANPAFPREFYASGNVFVNFSLVDCEPQHFADAFSSGEIVRGLADASTAFLTVSDGATFGVIVIPAEYLHPDGTVHFIFFEHPDGENFLPENSLYQSVPDIFDPGLRVGDAATITFDEFTLVPATE